VTGLDANGLQSKDSFRTDPEAVKGEEVLARHFPAGAGNPVQVVGKAESASQIEAALKSTPGIAAASVEGKPPKDGLAYFEGTLTSSPDSQAGYDAVDLLRSRVHAVQGADAKVGGGSAVNLDILRASTHDRNLVVPIVLVVVLIILGLVLRAIVAPLLLVATVLLSLGAALGVSTLVFNNLFHFAGADPSFPLWTFVFLVALGVDYNIFLMTRVHEESRRHGTRRGALIGLAATGGVITSAGVVLAGTFAALGTLPLVFITEIGFAVAFGVLLDTFIVRSVLVTALNLDVGRHIWWPSKLARKEDVLGEPEQEPAAVGR
jgi:RND superfamily putative drug exporter